MLTVVALLLAISVLRTAAQAPAAAQNDVRTQPQTLQMMMPTIPPNQLITIFQSPSPLPPTDTSTTQRQGIHYQHSVSLGPRSNYYVYYSDGAPNSQHQQPLEYQSLIGFPNEQSSQVVLNTNSFPVQLVTLVQPTAKPDVQRENATEAYHSNVDLNDEGIQKLVSSTQDLVTNEDVVSINNAEEEEVTEKKSDTSEAEIDNEPSESRVNEEKLKDNLAVPSFNQPIIVGEMSDASGRNQRSGGRRFFHQKQINVEIIGDPNDHNKGQFLKETTFLANQVTPDPCGDDKKSTHVLPKLEISTVQSVLSTVHGRGKTASNTGFYLPSSTALYIAKESTTVAPKPVPTKYLAPIQAGLRLLNSEKTIDDCVDPPKPEEKTIVEIQKSVNVNNILVKEEVSQQQEPKSNVVHQPIFVDRYVDRITKQNVIVEKPVLQPYIVEKPVDRIIKQNVIVEKQVPQPIIVEKPVDRIVKENVIVEKPVPQPIIVEKPVDRIVTQNVIVEKPVDRIVTQPIYVEKPVPQPVDRIVEKQVPVPYPVDRIVEKQVPTAVPVPYPVEKQVPVHHYIDRPVIKHVPVEVPVERIVEKPYPVEKVLTKEVQVPYPVTQIVEKIVDRPVEVEKIVTKEVQVLYPVTQYVDRPYPVEVPVEKIVEKIVDRPVDRVVEKQVEVPVPVTVEKVVEKIVDRPVPYPVQVPVEVPVQVPFHYPVEVPVGVPFPYPVEKLVPVPIHEPKPAHSIIKTTTHEKLFDFHKLFGDKRRHYNIYLKSPPQLKSPVIEVPAKHIFYHEKYPKSDLHFGASIQAPSYVSFAQLNILPHPHHHEKPLPVYSSPIGADAFNGKLTYPTPPSFQHQLQVYKDDYVGPTPLLEDHWAVKSDVKFRRSPTYGKGLRIEYGGFKPPLVPSLEIDENGVPLSEKEHKKD
ncbi:uncharacterized protein LOC129768184 isoform X2 [Toxorhynchites rutilus septentrionalis]|uniref:uncharacterized protein LOC129768184 isoform X2 n=1 Tax=Toxorhynchites rutilus septentrionalis TaxID=329112 RepID=UPI002478F5A7|nr:uncharacterized protein LOC129768184 isoform X2 [Toxorhynchites rutilus septentrionalis]